MKFRLRDWHMSDAERLATYANNPKIAENLRNAFPHPYTLEDAKKFIENCINSNKSKQLCLAIDVNGESIGGIGVFRMDDVYCMSAELGYWLGEPFWSKGIMSNAIRQICKMAFHQFDIIRIYAEPFASNIASRKVLEKAGFQLEGILRKSVLKNGNIDDSCLYSLLRDDVIS